MRILTRYVLFDLLKVFCIVLAGLTVLIYVGLIGKEAVDKGIGLGPLVRMLPYLLPQAMQFAVPAAMLLAATSVYGRMSSYNEIIAVKSLGISPIVLIWPTLVLAVLVSFGAVILNDIAVSWGRLGVQRVFLESVEEVTYSQLRMRRTYNLGRANMTVRAVDGHRLIGLTLVVKGSGDQEPLMVTAEEAELRSFPAEGKLSMKFYNFEIDGPATFIEPEEWELVLSLDELTGASQKSRSPSTYALAEIGPAVSEQQAEIDQLRRSMAAQAAFSLLTGDFQSLSQDNWRAYENDLAGAETRLHRLNTEPWRRWANGFSCFSFVMIGVPVAIRLRFSEMIASFFVCFLPILIVYYPLLAVSVDQAKDGGLPPQSVWLGNILLSLAGLWLLRKVVRY